jgi:hypothetical protein
MVAMLIAIRSSIARSRSCLVIVAAKNLWRIIDLNTTPNRHLVSPTNTAGILDCRLMGSTTLGGEKPVVTDLCWVIASFPQIFYFSEVPMVKGDFDMGLLS